MKSNTATALVHDVMAAGVYLEVNDRAIKYRGPTGVLTPERKKAFAVHRDEIIDLLEIEPIALGLQLIADHWGVAVEAGGEGDAAWSWIKASDHGREIDAAEAEVDRIGKHGDPVELRAACRCWIAAWANAAEEWRRRNYMGRIEIVDSGTLREQIDQECD